SQFIDFGTNSLYQLAATFSSDIGFQLGHVDLQFLGNDGSAPRERTVRDGMQFPLYITRESKGLEDSAAPSPDLSGDQLDNSDHLVAMVGVGDDITVFTEDVEYRETVGRKRANPT